MAPPPNDERRSRRFTWRKYRAISVVGALIFAAGSAVSGVELSMNPTTGGLAGLITSAILTVGTISEARRATKLIRRGAPDAESYRELRRTGESAMRTSESDAKPK